MIGDWLVDVKFVSVAKLETTSFQLQISQAYVYPL